MSTNGILCQGNTVTALLGNTVWATIHEESSSPKSRYTRVATIEPFLVAWQAYV